MIEVKNLTKSYSHNGKRKYVFKNLNFSIKDGESVCVLGGNGVGKSTLLRILGGIDFPDSGYINKNCSISWPFGVASGFQAGLTASENVKFVSKIFGTHSKKGIEEKIEIVRDFADIGDYFDRPYKTYSSGMKGRLSFGLSLAFKFDVYLLDEVLARGDIGFREKCKQAVKELKQFSSFIIVTHNYDFLKNNNIEKGFILHDQKMIEYDDVYLALKDCNKLLTKNNDSESDFSQENLEE